MRSFAIILSLFILASLSVANATTPNFGCGEPLVKAKLSYETPYAKQLTAKEITKGLLALSSGNLIFDEYKLQELDENETELVNKIETLPLFFIHRLSIEKFRDVLSFDALLSPYQAELHGKKLEGIITPAFENILFGGHDCVFMTLGPPFGRVTYGEVMIEFKESVTEKSWISPWSGWYFEKTYRKVNTDKLYKLSHEETAKIINDDEKRAFSQALYAGNDIRKAFSYHIISRIRENYPQAFNREMIYHELLSQKEAVEFWQIVDKKRLGYFEVKYPSKLPLSQAKRILIPQIFKETIKSWNGFNDQKKIIEYY